MNGIARNYNTRPTAARAARGEVVALGIALILGAGTLAAALAPDGDATSASKHDPGGRAQALHGVQSARVPR